MTPVRSVPITRPWLGAAELEAVTRVLQSGWLVQGSEVAEFERRFAEYVGTRAAVAASSCTTALHMAVVEMGAGVGDEVLVPAFTWVATANAVELTGATPVFVDVDLATFNIDPAAARAAITDRTVGMVPVHLFGRAAPIHELAAIAAERGLWMVEDAACALGTTVGDRHVGTFGDIGCFSFHPRKSITTGEGGMIVARSDRHIDAARSLRNHGVDPAPAPADLVGELADHPVVGFNYRMTDLQAAIGLAQLDKLTEILERRRGLAARYDEALAGVPWLKPPEPAPGHSYQAYVCLVSPGTDSGTLDDMRRHRASVTRQLSERGIGVRPGTHAPVRMTYYRDTYGLDLEQFPNACVADASSLALPLYAGMDDADFEAVLQAIDAVTDA